MHDSERLHLLQKMINLRQGKGTRASDQLPLRAMAPAFISEFEQRADYYEKWLEEHKEEGQIIPDSMEEKHELLIEIRQKAYQTLCDTVYKAKGYDLNSIPEPETLINFELLDSKAESLLKLHSAN